MYVTRTTSHIHTQTHTQSIISLYMRMKIVTFAVCNCECGLMDHHHHTYGQRTIFPRFLTMLFHALRSHRIYCIPLSTLFLTTFSSFIFIFLCLFFYFYSSHSHSVHTFALRAVTTITLKKKNEVAKRLAYYLLVG